MKFQSFCTCFLASFVAAFVSTAMAAQIEYTATGYGAAASLGVYVYTCQPPTDDCVSITVNYTGDLSDVQRFSLSKPPAEGLPPVVVADGFWTKMRVKPATATVSLYYWKTNTTHTATFLPGAGIYASVDQLNGGVGFGSIYGPTYPLGVYGNWTCTPAGSTNCVNLFKSYNLVSAFPGASGYTPFCDPSLVCTDPGPALPTSAGHFWVSWPSRPAFAVFSAKLAP